MESRFQAGLALCGKTKPWLLVLFRYIGFSSERANRRPLFRVLCFLKVPIPSVTETLSSPKLCHRNFTETFVTAKIGEQWFGGEFPYACPDGQFNAGADTEKLRARMSAYAVVWPDDYARDSLRSDGQIFDLIEFSYEHIAQPNIRSEHGYYNHYHYYYDQVAGRND